MRRIFISHSSLDNAAAEAMRDWLGSEGWQDVFLDLDPALGVAPGQRWRDELRKAGEQCAAVIVLLSPAWAASRWCLTEFLIAAQLGKEIFPVLTAPCPVEALPIELTANYQFADLSTPDKAADGHERLRLGLQRAGLHPGAFPWPPKADPGRPLFRGLRVFEEADAAIFFGRDLHITKALDALRRLRDGAPERMLAILGASGSGKSSFLRAGLLARLQRDTERFLVLPVLRPGRAALTGPAGLRRSLGLQGDLDGARIAAHLARLRAPVVEHLRQPAAARPEKTLPPTVVLPIDQAEELFVAEDREAAEVVDLITDTVESDRNVLLLLTIRSDSFSLLQGDPRLAGIPRLPFDLPRLPAAALKEVIEGPTRLPASGITIDPELTAQLIEDFTDADALPLLAFTLERLTAERGARGQLERGRYLEQMKGVGGAIRKAVELAFAAAAERPGLPHTRAELDALARRSFVPWLVRVDDVAATPRRRIALRRQLPPEALPLIDCLVDQRLLVTDSDGSEPTVEVSHEAVLRHWRELADWIAARRDELVLSERVTTAANDWCKADRAAKEEALVHRGERLRAAEALLEWSDLGWGAGDDRLAYLAACRAAERRAQAAEAAHLRRQRSLRQWVASLVLGTAVLTLLGAALVVTGQRNLGRAQSLMLARTAERFAESGDYLRALRLSILAARENALMPSTPEARAALSSNAQAWRLVMEARGHGGPVNGAVLSRDESRLLTWSRDGTARQWDVASGGQIGPALKHEREVRDAVFSRDEHRILSWGLDGTARLWDAEIGAQIGPALEHDAALWGAVLSQDETHILTWGDNDTARLWKLGGKEQVPELKHDRWVGGAVFSSDESRILTWSGDGTARLWDASSGAQIEPPLKHAGGVSGAVFTNDESRILTWGEDGTARLWSTRNGAQIEPPLEHRLIRGAAFSSNERRILTWGGDGTAQLWDAATGTPIGPRLKHDGPLQGAAFSNDDAHLLTWSNDHSARLWDAASGPLAGSLLKRFEHDGWVLGATFSRDGSRILTWSEDRSARLWDAASGLQIGPALKHDRAIFGATFTEDEHRVLSWSGDGTARLWNIAGGVQFAHEGALGAVSSKGRVLTWSVDGSVRQWDPSSGAPIGRPLMHDGAVLGAVFSRDGGRILTWSSDHTARLWHTARGEQIRPSLVHGNRVLGAVFSQDETRILTWSEDNETRLWDAASGALLGLPLSHEDRIQDAAFVRDNARILTRNMDGIGSAQLRNAATGESIGAPLGEVDGVKRAAFSKDASHILTFSWGGIVQLWDAADGAKIGPPLGPALDAVFSKGQGHILTWSDDRSALLWDAASGAPIGQPLMHEGNIWGAVLSQDGSRILTWSMDGSARLWDVATGMQIIPPLEHEEPVISALFTKDEDRILTLSGDGKARLWDVRWAMRDVAEAGFIPDLCREKLTGASVLAHLHRSAAKVMTGVRHLDEHDTAAAPILRGREGEDVCAPPPTAWQTLMSLLRPPPR